MTSRCVSSLRDCEDLEIFFNGSDGEAEKHFVGKYKTISRAQNLAFASVVNQALERCDGQEFLLFVTNDVTFLPGTIEKLLECMDCNPKLGLLGPLQLAPGAERVHHGGGSFDRKRWRADIHATNSLEDTGLIHRDWIDGAAMLIRIVAAKKVGPMRDEYGFYWEDVDWCIRFGQAGFDVGVQLDAYVTHESSGTTNQYPKWKHYLICRNRGLAAKLNLNKGEIVWVSLYLRLSIGVRLLRSGLTEKNRIYWAGIRDGLAGRWEGMNQPIADDDPIWDKVLRFP